MFHPSQSLCGQGFRRLWSVGVSVGLALCLAGCPGPDSSTKSSNAQQPAELVKLRVLVVGDPDLAKAIQQFEGEWNAQSGGEFKVETLADADPIPTEKLDVDAVIAPSYHLGGMVERKEVWPVPPEVLQAGEGNWAGIFRVLQGHEASWRGQVMAIPMGSPVLTIYYRADLLEKLRRQPPRTWDEYQRLAQLLADRKNLGDAAPAPDRPWRGALEPLGPGWAGLTLLARAAPYATHRGNYSTLFNVDTMQPLIDGPPFVRALEELVATAKLGPADPAPADPAAVRKAFWDGECAMALTWPTATAKIAAPQDRNFRVGFADLPGAKDVYNVSTRVWEGRQEKEEPRVPLVGAAGRLGMVTSRSAHPDVACRLLFWLSDDQWSHQVRPVCAASPMTTLFRKVQARSPREWLEPAIPASAGAQYGEVTSQALSREKSLVALRIPGRAEYLKALDQAVQRTLRGEAPAKASLSQAAADWQKITDRLGRSSQGQAYSHSVGL